MLLGDRLPNDRFAFRVSLKDLVTADINIYREKGDLFLKRRVEITSKDPTQGQVVVETYFNASENTWI